jgi:hypothetical protein
MWVSVGKPRLGPIFSHRQSTRRAYRCELRSSQEYYKNYYADTLHDSLMQKDGSSFWKCWLSKFNSHPVNFSVCGSVSNVFVMNFMTIFTALSHHILQIWIRRCIMSLTTAVLSIFITIVVLTMYLTLTLSVTLFVVWSEARQLVQMRWYQCWAFAF